MGLTKFSWKRSILFSYPSCPPFISFLFLFFYIVWQASRAMKVYQFFPPSFLSFSFHSFLCIVLLQILLWDFCFFLIVLFGPIAFFWGCLLNVALFHAISFFLIIVLNCLLNIYINPKPYIYIYIYIWVIVVLFNHYFSFFWFCIFLRFLPYTMFHFYVVLVLAWCVV